MALQTPLRVVEYRIVESNEFEEFHFKKGDRKSSQLHTQEQGLVAALMIMTNREVYSNTLRKGFLK